MKGNSDPSQSEDSFQLQYSKNSHAIEMLNRMQNSCNELHIASFYYCKGTDVFTLNEPMQLLFNVSQNTQVNFEHFTKSIHPGDTQKVAEAFDVLNYKALNEKHTLQLRSIDVNSAMGQRWVELSVILYQNSNDHQIFNGTAHDITPYIVEKTNNQSTEFFCKELFDKIDTNFSLNEIILNEQGKPIDYRFLAVNNAMEQFLGCKANDIIGKTALELFPKTEQYWIDMFAKVALDSLPMQYADYSSQFDRYYELKLFSPQKGQFAMLATDITEQTISQKRIKELKEHFELLFNLNPDAVTITRLSDGLMLEVNQGYTNLMGYTVDDIKGKSTLDLNIWVDENERMRFSEILKQKGRCENFESSFRTKSGQLIIGMVSSVIIENYSEPCILSVTRDITNRKKTEEAMRDSEKALREAQRVAGLGSYRLNFETGIWQSSDILNEIFGIDESFEKTIDRWRTIIHPHWRDEMLRYLTEEIIQKGQKFDKEYQIINQKSQETRWVHGQGELIYNNGKLKYMVGTIQDITQRKQVEMVVQEKKRKLEELNATQNKLFTIIAHDLRNPFGVMINLSELFAASLDDLNKDDLIQIAQNMSSVSRNTFILLENLLDWYKVQTGLLAVKIEQYNLSSIINDVLKLSHHLAKGKEIELQNNVNTGLMVKCDKDVTKTILRNLITNAIKFTHVNGKIDIRARQHHGFMEICVKDNGVGVSEDILSQLFSVSNGVSTYGTLNEKGSGLGLTLCKELVEKQGGSIWVKTELGIGSEFYFTLPESSEN